MAEVSHLTAYAFGNGILLGYADRIQSGDAHRSPD